MATLVCGATGSGKTILGLDFLINGAITYGETGIFISFEETADELYRDIASLNLDLKGLVAQKKSFCTIFRWNAGIFKRPALILKVFS